ncbi:MAG: hypothetical protein Q9204_004273 [Flavoplaca sp. TL-2023a]
MEPSRKRQRGAVALSNGDGYYADEDRQEGITEHGDRHGESGRCFSHSPLFLSRQTSEEPKSNQTKSIIETSSNRLPTCDESSQDSRLKFKAPSFLDHDDEEAFFHMGFRSAAPKTHTPSTLQATERTFTQQERDTASYTDACLTTLQSEPAIHVTVPSPPSPVAQQDSNVNPRSKSYSSTEKQRSKPASSARIIKPPREPNEALKRYTTALYAKYDPRRNNVGPVAGKFDGTFRIYDAYTLVVNPTMTLANLLVSGVRVDDFLAGKLLTSNYSAKALHQSWPAEFDHNGMIRATRMPLGHAAKRWRQVGESDINGKVIQQGQEGWYYDWWRGLHCLMGKEGYDAGFYLVRPSWEKFRCVGMTFKIGYKAVVQLPTSDPNDPTPGL